MRYFKATFVIRQWGVPQLDEESGNKIMVRLPDIPGETDIIRHEDDSDFTIQQLQGLMSPRPPYDTVINEVTESGEFIKQIYPE
jgi:hypothetical protein